MFVKNEVALNSKTSIIKTPSSGSEHNEREGDPNSASKSPDTVPKRDKFNAVFPASITRNLTSVRRISIVAQKDEISSLHSLELQNAVDLRAPSIKISSKSSRDNISTYNAIVQKPTADGRGIISNRYLSTPNLAELTKSIWMLYEIKISIQKALGDSGLESIDRMFEIAKAREQHILDENEAAKRKISAEQFALMMSLISAAIQLASIGFSVAGAAINNYINNPDRVSVGQAEPPSKVGTTNIDRTKFEGPSPKPKDEKDIAPPFVPGVSPKTESASSNLHISLDKSKGVSKTPSQGTLKVDLTPQTQKVESAQRSELKDGVLSVTLEKDLAPKDAVSSADQSAKIKMAEENKRELRDRINKAILGMQLLGNVISKIVTQSGQLIMSREIIDAIIEQKKAQKGLAGTEVYMEQTQVIRQALDRHQENIGKEMGALISLIKESNESNRLSAMKLLRG